MLHPETQQVNEQTTPAAEVKFPEQERMQRIWDNWLDEVRQGFDAPNMQEDER